MQPHRRLLTGSLALATLCLCALPLRAAPPPLPLTLPPGARTIIGGVDAQAGAWPWMVALLEAGTPAKDTQFCGATLIAPRWVLTAAHCVIDEESYVRQALPPGTIEVLVGLYRLSDESPAERIGVGEVILGDYDVWTSDHDIALLHLDAPSGAPVVPALVRPDDEATLAAVGVLGTAKGWGTMHATRDVYPDVLQEVQLPIADRTICNGPQAFDGALTDNMLCAGWAEGGKDTCLGDSGGPFVVPDPVRGEALAGIVSWGYGCADPGAYGAYTRVSRYLDWIRAQMTARGDPPDPCGPVAAPGACGGETGPEPGPEPGPEAGPEASEEVSEVSDAGQDVPQDSRPPESAPEVAPEPTADDTVPAPEGSADQPGGADAATNDPDPGADEGGDTPVTRDAGGGCGIGAPGGAAAPAALLALALSLRLVGEGRRRRAVGRGSDQRRA